MYWVIISIFKFLQKRNQFSKHKHVCAEWLCLHVIMIVLFLSPRMATAKEDGTGGTSKGTEWIKLKASKDRAEKDNKD